MARQIVIENPNQGVDAQDVDEQKNPEGLKDNSTVSGQIPTPSVDSVLISSSEIDKLYHEWDLNGQNDLFINPSLAERIKKYLAYQEELDPLKSQLAERIYKPFLITTTLNKNSYDNLDIKVNGKKVVCTSCYLYEGFYKIIHVSAFKSILTSIGNPYAPYINTSLGHYVDFLAYTIANGGSFEFDDDTGTWIITL